MDKIANMVLSLKDEMIKTRRFFHSHPETGFFTFFTTAVIADKLSKLGYKLKMGREVVKPDARQGLGTKEACKEAIKRAKNLLNDNQIKYLDVMEDGLTGLVAEIDTGRSGKLVAFRFDIDGVDVTESNDDNHRPFKEGFCSDIKGITHACGHDSHITMGLTLAKLIAENLDDFSGKFRFIFQTAEEGTRGAVAMEKAGVCDGIDFLLGAHMGFQADKIGSIICGGNKLLATTKFDVTINGVSAHAAGAPQDGKNALLAASQMALNMHGITRHSSGVTRVNVGVLRAGEGRNVIAPNGYLACETRGETTELNEFMFARCKDIIKGVSEIYGVSSDIKITGGTAGGDTDKEVSSMIYELAKTSPFITGEIIKEKDFGACEDFAHFMHSVQKNGGKSGYMMIGTDLKAGHHNSKFDINEDSMLAGVDMFLRASYKLNSK
ncbi:aminobenzoyl-glutamate utilization protein A [Campylobacter sputorum subsp. bubulus]|uniref:Aminobenzoyl-glutamate utilization protein A n=1 Tax=Campylobacter sputorum subsp. sputorum TaxID=32024 RepID=A0A381DJI9_9BACT|nr:amidohydrolase [Campylobacter sputorum]ASM35729.1 peptidase family M20/M25/M40, putative N-carbamoyl-L-amino acid amidohydrolase [Campylobacter sputorum aubsp. sputorum RM3237]KAB0580675.1 amidohydrolase [Campylobacter sputorum subsp. sputorum]QEL05919.1 zinc-dependent amidase/aminoacylase/carboxypeptidase, peptidase M20 family [Campylobacter sputorum subsp. sputorum]SUX09009.1 aminobenzoyl-glutamate utilization protein A [Campylobacter sputorum subsp. bubulus]SUX10697.1 aminobenzoyl-glutam